MSPSDLLAVARLLSEPRIAKGQVKQAVIRRSISTSYYAAFHAVLQAAANQFAGGEFSSSAFYLRVYRSPSHKDLKDICKSIDSNPTAWAKQQGLAGLSPDISRVASSLSQLYEQRIEADYDPRPTRFSWSDAQNCADRAEHVISEFSGRLTEEKACFLVVFAFKPSPR